jgi:hypothetical protein
MKCVFCVQGLPEGKGSLALFKVKAVDKVVWSKTQHCMFSGCYNYSITRKLHVSACGGHHQVFLK